MQVKAFFFLFEHDLTIFLYLKAEKLKVQLGAGNTHVISTLKLSLTKIRKISEI